MLTALVGLGFGVLGLLDSWRPRHLNDFNKVENRESTTTGEVKFAWTLELGVVLTWQVWAKTWPVGEDEESRTSVTCDDGWFLNQSDVALVAVRLRRAAPRPKPYTSSNCRYCPSPHSLTHTLEILQ